MSNESKLIRVDLSNLTEARYQLAMMDMTRDITDFDSFQDFVQREKDSMSLWSDERKKAFYARIDELSNENPEFKEQYEVFEKRRQERIAASERAIPLDDPIEASKKIKKLKFKNRFKKLLQQSPKKRNGRFEI